MHSAGKREIRPPDRLIDSLFPPDKTKMFSNYEYHNVNPTTSILCTTTTPTMSVVTTSGPQAKSVSEQSKTDPSVQSLLQKMMAKMNANHTRAEAQFETLHRKTEEGINQCIQRYQLTDTRLAKLEDESVVIKNRAIQQTTDKQVTEGRLTTLEYEIVQMRKEVTRLSDQYRSSTNSDLSQILKPTILSSTTIPINSSDSNNVSSIPPAIPTTTLVNTSDSQRSFFF